MSFVYSKLFMIKNYCAVALLTTVAFSSAQYKKDTLKTEEIKSVIILGKKSNFYEKISRSSLDVIQAPTIGETLSKISGIQNNAYGPNSGSPMIRSFAGNRVKVMRNGIGMNDLSGISPDYNIDFDADQVNNMEVYKSSATVLFGGKAIGGAVNIHNNTIPKEMNDKPLSTNFILDGSSNNGTRQSLSIGWNFSKKIVWNFGASNVSRDLVRIPSNTKSDLCYNPKRTGFDKIFQAMCQVNVNSEHILNTTIFPYLNQFVLDNLNNPIYELSENDKYTFEPTYYDRNTYRYLDNPKNPDFVPGQDRDKDRYKSVVRSITDVVSTRKGIMPNSHLDKKNVNFGIGYLGETFYTGIGYEGHYSYYGIPAYAVYEKPVHSHDPNFVQPKAVFEPINIDNRTHRIISESGVNFTNALVKNIKIKYTGQFSENAELIGSTVANRFDISQNDIRVEMGQSKWKFLSGNFGIDLNTRTIVGKGRMRYMPNSISKELGAFTLQNLNFGFVQSSIGYRHDWVKREIVLDNKYKKGRGRAGGKLSDRDFELNQFNALLKFNITKSIFISGSYNHSERAPEVNELYTGNEHLALLLEENGDDELKKEQADAFEISAGINFNSIKITTTAYKTRFKDFMYLGHTGISRNGFVVKEWRADDTEILGIETDASYKLKLGLQSVLEFSSFFDLVKNRDISDNKTRQYTDGGFMPNMPTSRYGFGLVYGYKGLTTNVLFERYLEQKYLGKNINPEPPMPAYNLLSARISYNSTIGKMNIQYYAYGSNLLNIEARPQNSLLKYIAPLPGINIGLGMKVTL